MNLGLDPRQALATNKLQATFGSASASWHYTRAGTVTLSDCVRGFILTLVGAALGTLTVRQVDPSFLRRAIPILLVAVAMLISTVSTSFFLPVFGTVCTFLASGITQQVFEYVHTPAAAQNVSPLLRTAVSVLYYLLPNLSGFDLKVNAIYSIKPNPGGLGITAAYFCAYTAMLLGAATFVFNRREMK